MIKIKETTVKSKCYKCSGKGYLDKIKNKCSACKGSGKWKEESYILIATQPDGQKIAFGVDSAGK